MSNPRRIIVSTALALALSSCSYVLDGVLAPFAPDYLPALRVVDEGVAVDDQIIAASRPSDTYEGKPVSWSMPYALYVFRSAASPYDGMELVARRFVANAAGVYTGADATVVTIRDEDGVALSDEIQWSNPQYDFRLTAGFDAAEGVENEEATSSGTFIDRRAPEGELFYRLSRITLHRYAVETELTLNSYVDGLPDVQTKLKVFEITYSLSSSTSGWATIINAP